MTQPITLRDLALHASMQTPIKAKVPSQWMEQAFEEKEIWVEIPFIKLDQETQTCRFSTVSHGRSVVLPWDCKVLVLDAFVLARPTFSYGIPTRCRGISID